ncbi:hypothetical protein IU429_02795 [Nocardia elegans]|uniref:Uncharacterized protein n=1 Tax=Nocardia elegans TaxID=300029 RepID=A0ABW6THJ1_9NOCA|nr:hypothetical protein [Nocardia elegans]MBF6446589.1 hypothetical protein [Nocardia elegans]
MESMLTEVLRRANLMELANQWCASCGKIHRHHNPDECEVHLGATYLCCSM